MTGRDMLEHLDELVNGVDETEYWRRANAQHEREMARIRRQERWIVVPMATLAIVFGAANLVVQLWKLWR